MTATSVTNSCRVGLIGSGALGNLIRTHLEAGVVPGITLTSVFSLEQGSLDHVLTNCDIVVEAAGQAALRAHGPAIVASGRTLVALSNGVLADDEMVQILTGGPGRFVPSAGAIGGFDLIDALRISGQLRDVSLHTVKSPPSLVQPWMSDEDRTVLEAGSTFMNVFTGSARDATRLFPANANVAATLGVRSIGLDRTRVIIDADPQAPSTRHTVVLDSTLGHYELTFANTPSSSNPKSSELAAFSVLHDLQQLTAPNVVICNPPGVNR
jgi:aspartate dehydrogenase